MAPGPAERTGHSVRTDLGKTELVPDPKRRTGWILYSDGVAQSYVDTADSRHLEFEYVRRVASVIDTAAPAGTAVDALHLGGGAMTIPRYVAATRPGSRQLVVERDTGLALLIHRHLPIAPGTGIDVRIGDARAVVETTAPGMYDLVVADVYRGASMPTSVTTTGFAAQVARVLRPGGVYAVNVTDLPALAFTRREAATLRDAFAHVVLVSEAGMTRGRRFGNVVLAAAHDGRVFDIRVLGRIRAGETAPVKVIAGDALTAFIAGAKPLTDITQEPGRTMAHRPGSG